MSHSCPDCGQACYCDMEDCDMGEDENCTHYETCGGEDTMDDFDIFGEVSRNE